MSHIKKIMVVFCALLVLPIAGANAAGLKFANYPVDPQPIGTSFTVDIQVDAPVNYNDVLGAAFTVTFDTTDLILNTAYGTDGVDSVFFDTFQTQFAGTSYTGPYSAEGYDQPLVINPVTGTGARLAAARVKAETDSTKTTLFTLSFIFQESATVGQNYPITITATNLNNTSAGYAATGEDIDLLVGYDSGTDTFPVALSSTGYTPVSINVRPDEPLPYTLDVDGNGSASPFSDGFIIIRQMMGYTCSGLTDGKIATDATLTCEQIKANLNDMQSQGILDVDGNGSASPFSDGFIIIRQMMGYTCSGLTDGKIAADATLTCEQIKANLDALMP